jgi:hypothetical protein
MTYELLPQDEPGNPLPDAPPGFIDSLMKRIEDDQRMRRRRRRTAVALTTALIAGGAYMIAARWLDVGPKQNIAHTQPGPAATPVVKTPPVPQPPSPQNAVKRDTPVPPTASHTPPPSGALQKAGIRPGDVKITIDGKEIRDPAQVAAILQSMDNCTPRRVNLVRDGKPVTYTVSVHNAGSSPCTSVPPRQ